MESNGRSPEDNLGAVGERLGLLVGHGEVKRGDAIRVLSAVAKSLDVRGPRRQKVVADSLRAGRLRGSTPRVDHHAEAHRVIDDLARALLRRTWTGRKEQTRFRLLVALLLIAEDAGKHHFSLSVREWGEEAGCSAANVSGYHPSLVPWVVRVTTHQKELGLASEWILGCPDSLTPEPVACSGFGIAEDTTPHTHLSLPSRGAMGAPAHDIHYRSNYRWRIFMWLDPERGSFTVRQVIEATGACAGTARTQLKNLERLGFVSRDSNTEWRALPGGGDPAALKEVEPVGRRRKQKHLSDRVWWFRQALVDKETGEIIPFEDARERLNRGDLDAGSVTFPRLPGHLMCGDDVPSGRSPGASTTPTRVPSSSDRACSAA